MHQPSQVLLGDCDPTVTSAADTNESVEAMLMLSLRQASSSSTSSASLSAVVGGKNMRTGCRGFHLHLHLHLSLPSLLRRRRAVFTWAAAVGGRLRHAQDALELLLQAVGPLQQRLQPVDELCTDDVLRVGRVWVEESHRQLLMSN